MNFTKIRTLWPEPKGFTIDRSPQNEYIFIYFHTPVTYYFGDRPIGMPAGTLIIYHKDSPQKYASPGNDMLHDWFHLTGDLPALMEQSGLEFDRIYALPGHEYITELIQQIELEWLAGHRHHRELAALMLHQLLLRIGRDVRQSPGSPVGGKTLDCMLAARRRIHMHYGHDWRVEEMAALIPISPSQFYNLYKQIFGVTPKKDLQLVRIMHAKTLLETGRYSVGEVAEKTGYASPYHFIRIFKSFTGVTPSKYK